MINNIWLITNYSCNNRCAWCYTEAMDFDVTRMPLPYAKSVLKEMQKNGIKKCTLIGGEPTVYPHLFEIIEYGRELGIFMKIVTNGRAIAKSSFLKRIKKAGISLIAISIHGSTAKIHNKITNTNSFQQTVKGIKNCLSEKMDFLTLTTINTMNQNNIYNIANFLTKLGVKNIVFNIAAPTQGKDRFLAKFVIPPDKLAKLIEKNYLRMKKEKIKASFYATMPLCLFDEKVLHRMIEEAYLVPLSNGGCNIYDGSGLGFDPLGNIVPCTHLVEESLAKTMNKKGEFIYNNQFKRVWGKIKNNFGKRNWKYPSKRCFKCKLKKDCIGGCLLFWKYFDPSKYIKE